MSIPFQKIAARRIDIARREGTLVEIVKTVKGIRKGKLFSDSNKTAYEIATTSGTYAFFKEELSPAIRKVRAGDKLRYFFPGSHIFMVAEVQDMNGNVLYRR